MQRQRNEMKNSTIDGKVIKIKFDVKTIKTFEINSMIKLCF